MVRQQVIWAPVGVFTGYVPKIAPIPYDGPMPVRLWTLYGHTNIAEPPVLPYVPKHHGGALLEGYFYDWCIRGGRLHYYSRVARGGLWLLLEFDKRSGL